MLKQLRVAQMRSHVPPPVDWRIGIASPEWLGSPRGSQHRLHGLRRGRASDPLGDETEATSDDRRPEPLHRSRQPLDRISISSQQTVDDFRQSRRRNPTGNASSRVTERTLRRRHYQPTRPLDTAPKTLGSDDHNPDLPPEDLHAAPTRLGQNYHLAHVLIRQPGLTKGPPASDEMRSIGKPPGEQQLQRRLRCAGRVAHLVQPARNSPNQPHPAQKFNSSPTNRHTVRLEYRDVLRNTDHAQT